MGRWQQVGGQRDSSAETRSAAPLPFGSDGAPVQHAACCPHVCCALVCRTLPSNRLAVCRGYCRAELSCIGFHMKPVAGIDWVAKSKLPKGVPPVGAGSWIPFIVRVQVFRVCMCILPCSACTAEGIMAARGWCECVSLPEKHPGQPTIRYPGFSQLSTPLFACSCA